LFLVTLDFLLKKRYLSPNSEYKSLKWIHILNKLAIIMKNSHYRIVLLVFLTFSCASQKNKSRYKSYEIFPSLSLNDSNSTKINELKFKPYFNSMDSQKFMFQKFGKWNNINATFKVLTQQIVVVN